MLIRIFALAAAAAAPAMAQDMSGPSQSVDWSGAYGGLTLGVATSDGEAERTFAAGDLIESDVERGLFPDTRAADEPGAIAGLSFGYNLQRGARVGGIELDISAPGPDVENGFNRYDAVFNTPTISGYETRFKGLATARLRTGYAAGRTLIYATGGIAASDVTNEFSLSAPNFMGGYTLPEARESGTRFGYVLGAGIERMISDRLSLKAEVLHVDLADVTIKATDPERLGDNRIDYEFDNSTTVARIGLNFAF